jgi:glycosyltransferase involved in cell wall biosynthesis
LEIAERKAASQSKLTLCIAKNETDFLRNEWKCEQAEFFPMSMPDEAAPAKTADPDSDGKLRLLHLGRIDSLPSYRSLEFLFSKVFPGIPHEILDRIEFLIAGECPDTPKAKRVLDLASPFPFCNFLGFEPDLRSLYSQADLQIVASTAATGLRTRIIESFAYEVPVLSSTVGAEGALGLVDGKNIMLADSPEDFRSALQTFIENPELRTRIALSGRRLYDETYSRLAVSRRLGELLAEHLGVTCGITYD